jgi:hypothetical protein
MRRMRRAPYSPPHLRGITAQFFQHSRGESRAMARRSSPEAQIQRAVFQHLRLRAVPRLFAFHPANGGDRKPNEAAVLKGLGIRAEVPNVIAVHEGRCYGLELKAGALCCIAEGLDRALAALEAWGLPRGQASKRISR